MLNVERVKPFLQRVDSQAIETGRQRMEKQFSGQESDYLPIIFDVDFNRPEGFPQFNYAEQYADPDKMAYELLWGQIPTALAGSDAQLALRANTGTGTVPSVFGLQQEILPDAMPWPKERLSRRQVSDFQLADDISQAGVMPHVREIIEFYRQHLPEVPLFVCDTQGPFDVAHLMYGDEIFTELYDDPPFCHHLMRLATDAYVKVTEYLKSLSGEAHDHGYHANMYMTRCGVRMCEDTTTLLSRPQIEQFVMPYVNQAMQHFGGGWTHYCGKNDHLLDCLIEQAPHCRAVNFGNPEMHDMPHVIARLVKAGKLYCGAVVRNDGEDLRAYFRRVLEPLDGRRWGLILMADLTEEERKEPRKVMDTWHAVQDEILN